MKILKTPLYKMHLISLEKDKEKVCDMILNSSKVHIDQPNTPISDETIKLLEEKIEKCENAIEILNKYNPYSSIFSFKRRFSILRIFISNPGYF